MHDRSIDEMNIGSSWPKISVVTPSFNQARFIEDTIGSVLMQGYPNLEYIIIDGGSADGSVDVIRKYEDHLAYWTSESDRGQTHAINKGWERATGQIYAWLNSDDLYAQGALNIVGGAFASDPDLVMCYGDGAIVDAASRFIAGRSMAGYGKESLLAGRSMVQPAVFLRSNVIEELGLLSENLFVNMDIAYFLRVWQRFSTPQIEYIPKTLAYERKWYGAKTVGYVWAGELLQVFQEFFDEFASEYRNKPDVRKRAYAGALSRLADQQVLRGQRLRAQWSALRSAWLFPDRFEGLRRLAILTSTIWLGTSLTANVRRTLQQTRNGNVRSHRKRS